MAEKHMKNGGEMGSPVPQLEGEPSSLRHEPRYIPANKGESGKKGGERHTG